MAAKGRRKTKVRAAATPVTRRPDSRLPLFSAAGLLFLGAWLLRLAFLEGGIDRGYPSSIFFHGDATAWWDYARALRAGILYDQGLPFHPPLFAYFLAGIETLRGATDFGGGRAALAALGGLNVALLYFVARRIAGNATGLAATVSWALSFPALVLATTPASELLYQTLLFSSLIVALSLWEPDTIGSGAQRTWHVMALGLALGVLGGLAALTRAEHLPLAALFALWAGTAAWRPRRSLMHGALVAAIALTATFATILPWSLHARAAIRRFNAAQIGASFQPLPEDVLITSYGPLNFALANHAKASAGFSRALLPEEGTGAASLDLRNPAHFRFYTEGYAIGWRYIRAHPGDWLRLAMAKLNTASAGLGYGWGFGNWPAGESALRRPVDIAVPRHDWIKWPLAFFAAFGTFVLLRDPRTRAAALLLAAVLLHRALLVVLFFGYARAAVLVLPFVHLFAAAGIFWFIWVIGKERSAHRSLGAEPSAPTPPTWKAALVGGLLVFAGIVALSRGERRYGVLGTTEGGEIIQDEPLAVWRVSNTQRQMQVPEWARAWVREVRRELREGVLNRNEEPP